MLKNWLSRYTLRYPTTLAYMLQASEYHILDYLSWHSHVKDFRIVEHRKKFVPTAKAIVLVAFAWAIITISCAAVIAWLWLLPRQYALAIFVLLLMPHIVAYGMLVPLLFLQYVIQPPTTHFITARAKKTLQSHKALKIAVAGSFGKTTMREILKTVLLAGKKVAAPPHSWNTPLGIARFVDTLHGDEEVLIFELGEYYPDDIKKLCKLVQPDIGIITGINEAHLEKFKTVERTARTIYELADCLKEKPTYVNSESELARKSARPGHTLYSRESTGEWKVTDAKTGLEGTSFTLTKGNLILELHSNLLGLHQIGPLAATADLALALGLSPEQVKSGIEKTKSFDHRLEPKADASGVVTLDDSYNGNPDGVKAVIDFLGSLESRRRWYITPGLVEMGPKTEAVHREIGKQLADARIEHIVLTKNSVTPYIEKGLMEANYTGKIIWFDDALAAFAALPHLTASGDVVLLQNDWPDQYR